jgi:hypothetical protein
MTTEIIIAIFLLVILWLVHLHIQLAYGLNWRFTYFKKVSFFESFLFLKLFVPPRLLTRDLRVVLFAVQFMAVLQIVKCLGINLTNTRRQRRLDVFVSED